MELYRGEIFVKLFTISIFTTMILLLVLFIIVPVINIHLFIKHRLNTHLYLIHIISGLIEAFLFCLMMQLNILPDSIRRIYSLASLLFLLFIFFTLLIIFFTKNGKQFQLDIDQKLSPKLTDVFQMMEDAIFIADRNGVIVNMNQTAKCFIAELLNTERLLPIITSLPMINTLSELSSLIFKNLPSSEKDAFLKLFETVPSASQIELNIDGIAYLLLFSPIFTGSKKKLSSLGINLVFHNIQVEKELRISLQNQNTELYAANEALKETIKISNTLEEEKERLYLIKELQNSIIHSIETVTDNILQFKTHSERKTAHDYQNYIATIADKLRHIFKEVRLNILKLSNRN